MAIYFITISAIALYAGVLKNVNNSERKKKKFVFLAFGTLTLIAMMRSPSVGIDLAKHYARNYTAIASLAWEELPAISILTGYELGFVYFCKLISLISHNVQWFIAVTSIIVYSVIGRFIYRYSNNVFLSTYLFITSCCYYMLMNILRQALAVSIILLAYDFLCNKEEKGKISRYLLFITMVLLATSFHQSAIIALLFILFDVLQFKKKHWIYVIVVVFAIYSWYDSFYLFFIKFVSNGQRYLAHITNGYEGEASIDIYTIINILLTMGAFVLGYYYLILKRRKIGEAFECYRVSALRYQKESTLLYLSLMAGTCRMLTTRMNILNRATFYFLPFVFIVYPLAIKNSINRKLLTYVIYILFGIYFLFMTLYLAGDYYGVVPFQAFWQ